MGFLGKLSLIMTLFFEIPIIPFNYPFFAHFGPFDSNPTYSYLQNTPSFLHISKVSLQFYKLLFII